MKREAERKIETVEEEIEALEKELERKREEKGKILGDKLELERKIDKARGKFRD